MRRVVAIGGGTGMPVLLESLSGVAETVDAIVTVADDGGSSGKLRDEIDGFPPGDGRNCLVALAEDSALSRLFQYRFPRGESLRGHALGNLIISALVDMTGDFRSALAAAGELLGARGRVMPPSLAPLTLYAEVEPWPGTNNGAPARVTGQCNVANRLRPLRLVGIEPAGAKACPEATAALGSADTIILGPGSLYTSVIANLLVGGVGEAVREARAKKVFLCNTSIQRGETDGYSATDHLSALRSAAGVEPDLMISSNTGISKRDYAERAAYWEAVKVDSAAIGEMGLDHIVADLTDKGQPTRHDSDKLGSLWREIL